MSTKSACVHIGNIQSILFTLVGKCPAATNCLLCSIVDFVNFCSTDKQMVWAYIYGEIQNNLTVCLCFLLSEKEEMYSKEKEEIVCKDIGLVLSGTNFINIFLDKSFKKKNIKLKNVDNFFVITFSSIQKISVVFPDNFFF